MCSRVYVCVLRVHMRVCVHVLRVRARARACVCEHGSVSEGVGMYLTDNLSHVKRVAQHFSNVLPAPTRVLS